MLAKWDYVVYSNIGLTPLSSHRALTVLDTGAGPNLIRPDFLVVSFLQHFWFGPLPNICDSNSRPLKMLGTVWLPVRLNHHFTLYEFIVCKTFAASAVLDTDFCSRFVKVIFPTKRVIELNNKTIVLIVGCPLKLVSRGLQALFPASLEDTAPASSLTSVIKSSEALTVPSHSQSLVKVIIKKHGLIVRHSGPRLYLN